MRQQRKIWSDSYGGELLIGLKSLVVKAHGSSNAKAIKNAVRQCVLFAEADIIGKMKEKYIALLRLVIGIAFMVAVYWPLDIPLGFFRRNPFFTTMFVYVFIFPAISIFANWAVAHLAQQMKGLWADWKKYK